MELFMAVADKYPTDQWHTFIHPDFTEEEIPMLKWTIDLEIERYKANPELWKPIALEYQIVDHEHKIRGIIDRIDQIDDSTVNIIEYKTSKSHDKAKLQMEFGFYDLLLDAVPELEGYKRKYTVIYPRFQKVIELNPSNVPNEKRIKDIFDAIENDSFKPACVSMLIPCN
jgi:hypothetical protein